MPIDAASTVRRARVAAWLALLLPLPAAAAALYGAKRLYCFASVDREVAFFVACAITVALALVCVALVDSDGRLRSRLAELGIIGIVLMIIALIAVPNVLGGL